MRKFASQARFRITTINRSNSAFGARRRRASSHRGLAHSTDISHALLFLLEVGKPSQVDGRLRAWRSYSLPFLLGGREAQVLF